MERVVIFGICDFAIALSRKIHTKYNVVAFVDNDETKQGKYINGIPVIHPAQIFEYAVDKIIMGTNSVWSQEAIKKQIRTLYFPLEKLCLDYVSKVGVDATEEILLKQHDIFHGKCLDGFLNFNIITILLGVEECFGKNTYGLALCRKYRENISPVEQENVDIYMERFKRLVQEFDGTQWNEGTGIVLNRNGRLIDGSHRLAICLYHGVKEIPVITMSTSVEILRDWNWFLTSEIYTSDELDVIKERYHLLMKQYHQRI